MSARPGDPRCLFTAFASGGRSANVIRWQAENANRSALVRNNPVGTVVFGSMISVQLRCLHSRAARQLLLEHFLLLAVLTCLGAFGCRPAVRTSSAADEEEPPCSPGEHSSNRIRAFTVREASCTLRDGNQSGTFEKEEIAITGYVTATNLPDVPPCANHRPGVSDPVGCSLPVPAFWIGNTRNASRSNSIRVVGWASQYAQVLAAKARYAEAGAGVTDFDVFWGVPIPNPIPEVGARVVVVGRYGVSPLDSSRGTDTNYTMGILTYSSMKTIEPAPAPQVASQQ